MLTAGIGLCCINTGFHHHLRGCVKRGDRKLHGHKRQLIQRDKTTTLQAIALSVGRAPDNAAMQLAVGKRQLALPLKNVPGQKGKIHPVQLNLDTGDIGQIDQLSGLITSRLVIQARKIHPSGLLGVIFFMRSANAHVAVTACHNGRVLIQTVRTKARIG